VKESLTRLAKAMSSLGDAGSLEAFLAELLTPTELHDLSLRWELLELLAQGASQRQIAAKLGVSLCKITRGAKILKRREAIAARLLGSPCPPIRKAHHDGADIAIKPADKARC